MARLALADAEDYYTYIRIVRNEPEAADKWFDGLYASVRCLQRYPLRCPRIPEHEEFPVDLRQLAYHSHRIVFRVREESHLVMVYRIYHSSRRRLTVTDLPKGAQVI